MQMRKKLLFAVAGGFMAFILHASVQPTALLAQSALAQVQETFAVVKDDIAEDSELYYKLGNTLDELAAAARSIRGLADYLEQHPEALLQGKNAPGGK